MHLVICAFLSKVTELLAWCFAQGQAPCSLPGNSTTNPVFPVLPPELQVHLPLASLLCHLPPTQQSGDVWRSTEMLVSLCAASCTISNTLNSVGGFSASSAFCNALIGCSVQKITAQNSVYKRCSPEGTEGSSYFSFSSYQNITI